MNNKDCFYKPSGELQGDSKGMPDRGTGTGLNGDTYGADISTDSTNSMGSIRGSTRSDPIDKDSGSAPNI